MKMQRTVVLGESLTTDPDTLLQLRGGLNLMVHSQVLCMHCSYFNTLLSGIVGDDSKATTDNERVIDLTEVTSVQPEDTESFFGYIYGTKALSPQNARSLAKTCLYFHGIDRLREEIDAYLTRKINLIFKCKLEALAFGQTYNCKDLARASHLSNTRVMAREISKHPDVFATLSAATKQKMTLDLASGTCMFHDTVFQSQKVWVDSKNHKRGQGFICGHTNHKTHKDIVLIRPIKAPSTVVMANPNSIRFIRSK